MWDVEGRGDCEYVYEEKSIGTRHSFSRFCLHADNPGALHAADSGSILEIPHGLESAWSNP